MGANGELEHLSAEQKALNGWMPYYRYLRYDTLRHVDLRPSLVSVKCGLSCRRNYGFSASQIFDILL